MLSGRLKCWNNFYFPFEEIPKGLDRLCFLSYWRKCYPCLLCLLLSACLWAKKKKEATRSTKHPIHPLYKVKIISNTIESKQLIMKFWESAERVWQMWTNQRAEWPHGVNWVSDIWLFVQPRVHSSLPNLANTLPALVSINKDSLEDRKGIGEVEKINRVPSSPLQPSQQASPGMTCRTSIILVFKWLLLDNNIQPSVLLNKPSKQPRMWPAELVTRNC